MKKYVLSIMLFIYCGSLSAQEFSWVTQFGSNYNDWFYDAAIDNEANLILCGPLARNHTTYFGTNTLFSDGYDSYIAKYDSIGSLLWTRQYFGESYNNYAWDIETDQNGDIYLATTFSDVLQLVADSVICMGVRDIVIEKISKNGNSIWHKQIGGIGDDEVYSLNNYQDKIYLIGLYEDAITIDNLSLSRAGISLFIYCMDTNGTSLWLKHMGDSTLTTLDGKTTMDPAGNLVLSGQLHGSLTFGTTTLISENAANGYPTSDIFITKYNGNGDCLWATKAGGNAHNEMPWGVTCDSKQNIYITGICGDSIYFDSIILHDKSTFLAKLDPDGNFLWAKDFYEKTLKPGEWVLCQGRDITTNANDEVILTGEIGYYATDTTGIFIFGEDTITTKGAKDAFVAKYDSLGNALWVSHMGGNEDQMGYKVISFDNYVYALGRFQLNCDIGPTTINARGGMNHDAYITKIKDLDSIASEPNSIANHILNSDSEITIYPNPYRAKLTINNPTKNTAKVTMYSIMGQVLQELELNPYEYYIWNDDNAPGIRIILIETKDSRRVFRIISH